MMMASSNIQKKPRMLGIDLFRGLAIYAVVILHADEGVKVMPPTWSWITDFALFAVPFFLATAFYLAIKKLYLYKSSYPLGLRLIRLLIPYGCWSLFYLLYKAAKYTVAGELTRTVELFRDPLSLIFLGGAAFHLYFIPLLIAGTFLIKFSEFLIRYKVGLKHLGLITLISLLLYEVILVVGNHLQGHVPVNLQPLQSIVYSLSNSNPLLQWFQVELSWLIRCFPYVMLAMLLAHPSTQKTLSRLISKYSLLWLLVFFICNAFGTFILPESLYELARGYTALLAAISISSYLKANNFIANLGICSFGIYLVHLFFVEIFQSIAVRIDANYINQINTIQLVAISSSIFAISWITTILLMKHKNLSRFLFGY